MDRAYCEREHRTINDSINRNETRLNDHSGRIKTLENYQSSSEVKIENLCDQIKQLVKAIYWLIGMVILGLGGFFMWYVQSL